jgi:mono/diheme cytochrome c family protein
VIHGVLDIRFRFIAMMVASALAGSTAVADETAQGSTDRQSRDDQQQKAEKQSPDDRWAAQGWPLVQNVCHDCHNADDREAELDLSQLGDPDAFQAIDGSLKRILEIVRFGAMPPEDADQPSDEERKSLVDALDHKLYAASCDLTVRPGRVTARRLNRAEYNHSVRDLFGIDFQPANDFPSDEVGAGFDNNSDVLSLSPILMEKYIEAAEKITEELITDPSAWPKLEQIVAAEQLFVSGDAKLDTANGWFVAPGTFVWTEFEVPTSGTYRLSFRGGASSKDKAPLTVAVYDDTGLLRAFHRMQYFGGGRSASRSLRRIELSKGKQRLYFVPILKPEQESKLEIGESVSEQIANIDDQIIADAKAKRDQEHQRHKEIDAEAYPFLIRQIDLRGPHEYSPAAFSDAYNRVVISEAKQRNNQWRDVSKAASECLRPVMRRAFRGQVSDEEVRAYVDLVTDVVDRGDSYYRGLRVAITGVLVSPRFLFRIETPPEDFEPEPDGSVRLTDHQLATRLSYFLWASTPDEALLDDADDSKLKGAVIDNHVRRMLQDPRADALATQFAAQWLGLRNLERHEADNDRFAAFTPTLRAAMKRETELLFLHLVRENKPIADLLTCDFTFVNDELASHYGIDGVQQKDFKRVSLVDLPRRGVLSHASVLTLTSNPQRTSPVKRGKWILENIIGTPPPDPPAGVPDLEETKTAKADASFREQLELHRASPACASCHRVMDQLGFGLEQFDPIGGFRESERDRPVDSSGELPGGLAFDGAVELTKILAEGDVENFAGVVVERLMTFALGRELSPTDRCTVAEIVENAEENGFKWVDLILEVVRSPQFQYYDLPSVDLE